MKIKILLFAIIICLGWASQTRMNTLLCGEYIEDLIYIDLFPQHIMVFANYFYGDILRNDNDYGITLSLLEKYGSIGIWQREHFNIGYAINLKKLNIGFSVSPLKDQNRIGFGIGFVSFDYRCDFSTLVNKQTNINESYGVNIRCLKRKDDFIFIPKYNFANYEDYQIHKIGLMLERLVLNEGFVFLAGEYNIQNGAIDADFTNLFLGLELPFNKTFVLQLGVKEKFNEDFIPTDLQTETGLGLKIREFTIDFHLNKERFFSKDFTIFNSLGLDLNFGRF